MVEVAEVNAPPPPPFSIVTALENVRQAVKVSEQQVHHCRFACCLFLFVFFRSKLLTAMLPTVNFIFRNSTIF